VGTSTTGYSYPPDSHRLEQVGTQACTFDAAGNMLTDVSGYTARGLRGHYDHRNRLSHIGDLSEQFSARWEYNGRGERVYTRVSDLQAWTDTDDRYAYDESGQLIGSYRSEVEGKNFFRAEEIVWLDNTPVARVVIVPSQGAEEKGAAAGIEVHAIHTDHLNTPRALVNAQTQGGQPVGTVIWRWRLVNQGTSGSNAFGAMAAEEDPDGNGTTLRFDLRFPGQQYDASTGLHYNYFRDYEAGTGRYVESDPIGLRGGLSTHGYALQNPLRYSDPEGLATEAALGWCIAGGPANPLCDAAIVVNVCKWVGIGIGAMLLTGDTPQDCDDCPDSSKEQCYQICWAAYEAQATLCRKIRTREGRRQCWANAADLLGACQANCK
jgi:RHS repeat-associated protein